MKSNGDLGKIILLLLKFPDSSLPYRELFKYFSQKGANEESLAFQELLSDRFNIDVNYTDTCQQ